MFAMALERQPSIIFMDEVGTLLSSIPPHKLRTIFNKSCACQMPAAAAAAVAVAAAC
jgi:hypothetical protein